MSDQGSTIDPAADPGTTTVAAPRRTGPPGGRPRSIGVGVLAVLAVIGVLASTLAIWTRATLFDSERIGEAVGEALAEPAVQASLAIYLTDQVLIATDLEGRVGELLPERLQPLTPAIVGGARTLLQERLAKMLAEERWRVVVERLVVVSHKATVRLLEGDGIGSGLSVDDGAVTLNLLPLVGRGIELLQENGLLTRLDLPDLTEGTADEQLAALEDAIGRDLPDDFAQLVVYRSDKVAEAETSLEVAQRLAALFKRGVVLIVAVTVALVAAAVLLSARRRRTVLQLSLGIVAVMVLARVAVQKVLDAIPTLLVDPGARAMARRLSVDLTIGLLRLALLLAIVGALAALLAWWPRLRRGGDAEPSGPMSAGAGPSGGGAVATTSAPGTTWLQRNAGTAAVAVYALAVVSLVVMGIALIPLVIAAALVVAGIALQASGRSGTASSGDGETTR